MRRILGWVFNTVGGSPMMFAFGALLAVLTWKTVHVEILQRRLVAAHEVSDSLQLDAWNERTINNKVVTYLRDSLIRVSRQAVAQRRPAAQVPVTATIVATVEPIRATIEAVVDTTNRELLPIGETGDSAYVRTYEFRLAMRPIYGLLWADVIEGSPHARLRADLNMEPARLLAQIQCGLPVPPIGLRQAELLLQGPAWLKVDSLLVQSDPSACNPPRSVSFPRPGLIRRYWWVPVLAGVTYFIGRKS